MHEQWVLPPQQSVQNVRNNNLKKKKKTAQIKKLNTAASVLTTERRKSDEIKNLFLCLSLYCTPGLKHFVERVLLLVLGRVTLDKTS